MDINIKDQKIVTEDEIKKQNGIVYDFGDEEKLTAEGLPNAEDILDQVIKILEIMDTPEMKTLRETNQDTFENIMEERFENFAFQYYSVFKMIISGEDITPLFAMLKVISQVNYGEKSFEDGEKDVGQYLNKFLPDGLLEKLEQEELEKSSQSKKIKRKKIKRR